MSLLTTMAFALAATLIPELLFALAWGLRRKQLLIILLMNVLTNPAANVLYSFCIVYLGWPTLLVSAVLELAVVTAEGFCCTDLVEKPWAFAILCNLVSYTFGFFLQRFLGGII